jgi:ubiquinone/menaquinone biosynthesis C-methylase UbiE
MTVSNPLAPWLYDRVMAVSENAGLARQRARLLAGATGAVLEIGCGTGLNLEHYPATVTRLVLTDPDPRMRARSARRASELGRAVEVVDAQATALPFLENTFDEVTSTLVLCHVPRRVTALHEVRRVLKPGGRLRFLEHVAGRGAVAVAQRLVQPVHQFVAGGCRLDHRMTATLREAGFVVAEIADWSLPRAPFWVAPAVVGVARAPAPQGP